MTIDLPNAGADDAIATRPSVTVWSRLEVDPCATTYDESLTAALADPLWMLARQWQFCEFAGEDAGTPIDVRGIARVWPFAKLEGRGPESRAVALDASGAPLEAMVEAEEPDLAGWQDNARAGHFFLQLVDRLGVAPAFRLHPPFGLSELPAGTGGLAALLGRRSIDGAKLADAIATAEGIPAELETRKDARADLARICLAWLDWYRGSLPGGFGACRKPRGFGSDFTLTSGVDGAPLRLDCRDHAGGRLDWHAFDIAANGATPQQAAVPIGPVIPAPVRFAGMASDRFWEFEDDRVHFGAVDAAPTDLGRLLVIEFALVFGNDWFVVPVSLPNGCVARIETLTVRDTFGSGTEVPRFDAGNPAWRMFDLANPGGPSGYVALLATTDGVISGEPVEEIGLFRDEMANLAWAVELRTPDVVGLPCDRPLPNSIHSVGGAGAGSGRAFTYRPRSEIPANWFPLVPAAAASSHGEGSNLVLHRGDGENSTLSQPRGTLLGLRSVEGTVFQLDSSEIPAPGLLVSRMSKFVRGPGGERFAWTGTQQRPGFLAPTIPFRFDYRLSATIPGSS